MENGMKKIFFPIIIAAFCLLPITASGADTKCIEGDCVNGKGIYQYSDGSRYTGEFAEGVRSGQGTLTIVGGIKYEGQWADDLPNGQGVKTLEDGMRYSGEFQNGVMHGLGSLIMPDGNRLKIKWDNALPSQENWYPIAIPENTQKFSNRAPQQSAGQTAVSPENLSPGEAPPAKEPDQAAVPPEQAVPQAPEEDLGTDIDKKPTEAVSNSLPPEMVKVTSEAAPPAPQAATGTDRDREPAEASSKSLLPEMVKIKSEAAPPAPQAATGTDRDREPAEASSKSLLPEKVKIKSEAAPPAAKQAGPEPEGKYFKNPETADKVEYASITAGANIRAKASLKSDVLRTVPPGYPVVVLEKQPNWFLVQDYRGRKGWLYASLVAEPATVIIKVFKGNLRSGPSLKDNVIVQLDHGTIMTVLKRKGEWLKVSDLKELTGWLYSKVVWPAAAMKE